MESGETLQPDGEYQGEEPEEGGFGSRLVSVFVAPRDACSSLARRPDWFLPLLVVALVAAAVGVLLAKENALFGRDMMADASRVEFTEEQLARMGEVTTQRYVTTALGAVFWTAARALLYGLLLFLVGKGIGGGARFKAVFSVTCYSSLIMALGGLVALAVVKLTGTYPVETSLAVLSGESYWSLGRVALQSVEIFWIWQLVFLTIGMSVVQGFTMGRAAVAVAVLFLVRGGVLVGVTALTRGFLGVG